MSFKIEDTPELARQQVISSMFLSVGYDKNNEILEVEFTNKDIYRYSDIPNDIYQAFVKSSSMGKYYLNHIKGQYTATKL